MVLITNCICSNFECRIVFCSCTCEVAVNSSASVVLKIPRLNDFKKNWCMKHCPTQTGSNISHHHNCTEM